MIARSRIVLFLAIACGAAAAAQQPARDDAPRRGRPARSPGTVFVGGAAKQPARRVRVTLTNVAARSPVRRRPPTTTARSRFAASRRPVRGPGVQERLSTSQLRRVAPRAPRHARRRERRRGRHESRDDDRARRRHRRRARDMRGRPVPGVNVRVLKLGYNAVTGERTLGAPSSGASTSPTIAAAIARSACRPAAISWSSGHVPRGERPRRHPPDHVGRGAAGAASGRSGAASAGAKPRPACAARRHRRA